MELPDLGVRVRLFDTEGNDLGLAQAPEPVELDGIIALADGSPWRVVSVIHVEDCAALDALCEVEPASSERRARA